MSNHASGPFEVKLTPQPGEQPGGPTVGRMTIDKQFHGDLEASSRGEMLAFSSTVPGSAGYVAMELVTGSLAGRNGSFVLQHSATMNRGKPELSITVVPDTGTGELEGLKGRMLIIVAEDGRHSYEFDYSID